eukprot:TRINITY_DN7311_c0_g2_i3.p3 TRINITY_DN7311_c0_g2~~TRINITY_DN7311_c0_g2_i3.p3  ORF type:complete len:122 (+),score=26.14 TRINITY_DN7311_c0_g2_i3:427-792(+)
MAGGDKAKFESVLPCFEKMGKNIVHTGAAGTGQHTKVTNQILICTTMIGLVEGLFYASAAGLDLHTTLRAVAAGAAGSFSLNVYAPRIFNGNYEPGFFVEHFVKAPFSELMQMLTKKAHRI